MAEPLLLLNPEGGGRGVVPLPSTDIPPDIWGKADCLMPSVLFLMLSTAANERRGMLKAVRAFS